MPASCPILALEQITKPTKHTPNTHVHTKLDNRTIEIKIITAEKSQNHTGWPSISAVFAPFGGHTKCLPTTWRTIHRHSDNNEYGDIETGSIANNSLVDNRPNFDGKLFKTATQTL